MLHGYSRQSCTIGSFTATAALLVDCLPLVLSQVILQHWPTMRRSLRSRVSTTPAVAGSTTDLAPLPAWTSVSITWNWNWNWKKYSVLSFPFYALLTGSRLCNLVALFLGRGVDSLVCGKCHPLMRRLRLVQHVIITQRIFTVYVMLFIVEHCRLNVG